MQPTAPVVVVSPSNESIAACIFCKFLFWLSGSFRPSSKKLRPDSKSKNKRLFAELADCLLLLKSQEHSMEVLPY
jgi:hypothetical protein